MKILLLCLLFFSNSFLFAQRLVDVYTQEGCGRCAYVVEQLTKSGVKFNEIDTEDEAKNDLMWNKIWASDPKITEITMPVVVFNQKTYVNIPDLKVLCKEIVAKTGGKWVDLNYEEAENTEPNEQMQQEKPANTPVNGDPEPANMKGIVTRHNFYRKEVGVKDLVWSNELAAYAQAWANELARKGCELEHRPYDGKWAQKYGENIFWAQGMNPSPEEVTDSWGSEKAKFDFEKVECKGEWYDCGHYTQVIWEKTTQVGCAFAKCGDKVVWVCNYNPPGNYTGQKAYKKKK